MVCHCREPLEDVGKVCLWFDAVTFTGFQQCVDDRTTVAGFGVSNVQPVFGAEFAGPDTLLGEVVIDAGLRMVDKGGQLGPLGQGIVEDFI